MTVVVMPDAEGAVRAWLRGLSIPALGRNVWFGFPKAGAQYPLAIVSRVGGSTDGYAPVDNVWIQIDVYSKSRQEAATVAYRIAAEIDQLDCGTPMGAASAGGGWVASGPVWRPDDDRTLSRFVIDARFSLRPGA